MDLDYHVVGPAPSAALALALLQQTSPPDMALLDINLGQRGPDGIELAKTLLAAQPLPIIFLTSQADRHSFERARQLGPAAYLVKPVDPAAMQRAIELAMTNFVIHQAEEGPASEASEFGRGAENPVFATANTGALLPTALFIKENGILVKVRLLDVSWVMAEGRHCRLALSKGSVLQVRQPLREICQHLPAEQFVQIQRSYIINAECIERIDTVRNIVQVDGHLLPIGLVYRDKLLQRLNLV